MAEGAETRGWNAATWIFTVLRARPGAAAAVGGLLVLALLAALPFDPQGPYDARDYSSARGVRLDLSDYGALVEPLASIGHAIAGAPDFRVAGVSSLVWAALLAGAALLVTELGRRPRRRPLRIALRSARVAAVAGGVFLVYVGFALLVRLPSWRLAKDAPDLVIADLQTHTFGSHDGLVSARENLEWHAARGFEVVAVTEHKDPSGAVAARDLARADGSLPGVIAGIETWWDGYLLALNFTHGARPPWRCPRHEFVEAVRAEREGAVLVLPWKLRPRDVERIAADGVDGFEIANFGHPDVPDEVREAILDESKKRGLVLVASSDWHGWSGFARTWTAVRVPGARDMEPNEKAAAVLTAIRERRAQDIVPVVAGRLGSPSPLRAVFAPFVELARYAMELSAVRVLAWWVWVGAILGLAEGLRRARLRPGRMLLYFMLLVLGAGLVVQGLRLVWAWAEAGGSSSFAARVGGWGMGVGVAAVFIALAMLRIEVIRRSRERRPE